MSTYASRYAESVLNSSTGALVKSTALVLMQTGTGAPGSGTYVTTYTDRTKGTVASSVGAVSTDANGNLLFYADPPTSGGVDIYQGGVLLMADVRPVSDAANASSLADGGGLWVPADNTVLPSTIAATTLASYAPGAVVSWAGRRMMRGAAGGNESIFDRSKWLDLGSADEIGIYSPKGWGSSWFTKVAAAKAGSGKATAMFVGDSITQGADSTSNFTTSYVGLIKQAAKNYADGGSGFFGVANSLIAFANTAWASTYWSTTGTWVDFHAAHDGGPGLIVIYPSSTTGSITSPAHAVRGRYLRILFYQTAPDFYYQIDGGATVHYTTPVGSPSGITPAIDMGTTGEHTVVISTTSTAGIALYGIEATNTTGIVIHNMGLGGAQTSQLLPAGSGLSTPSPDWNGGSVYPADLIVYVMGANDCAVGVSGDTYLENTRQYLEAVLNITSSAYRPDLLIVRPHIGTHDHSHLLYADYAGRLRGLAETYGAKLVDFWPMGKNNYTVWANLGYWGDDTGSPGAAGASEIHPSDAGHAFMASVLAPMLFAA